MARVLVLAQFFPPETFSGANRVASLARALASEHAVVVRTFWPSYPDPALYTAESTEAADTAAPHTVRRALHFTPHGRSLRSRALADAWATAALTAVATLRSRPDIVLASSPSMFFGPWGLVAARVRRARFVWDVRDLTWQLAAEEFGEGADSVALAALQKLMWATARRAWLVTVPTDGSREAFIRHGVAPERVLVAPNAVAAQLLEELGAVPPPPDDERLRVVYAGLLGLPQGLSVLLDAAEQLPEVDVVLAGRGPEGEQLQQAAADRGLANVTFPGYLTRPEVLRLYGESHVLFAQLKDTTTLNDATIPSKLYEYMSAGRPVVYGGRGAAAELVENAGAGVVVPPGDAGALVETLRGLLADPERRRELGERGRAHVRSSAPREEVAEVLLAALRDGGGR